ncbi:spondin domain-containing protein [Alistipes sp.]|uniref:spondin domain-containing protein n=1 Tax=Alistipes sp. TaxID=1872444 RepID=UPI003A88EAD5
MKRKYFSTAVAAALLFAGSAFTSCNDDDDDNVVPGTRPTIKFENVVATKNFVQSGTFAAVNPGQTTSFKFHAGKGQRLMLASMYAYSNDLFFAPANPGIALFDEAGVPNTGIIAGAVRLWDNGTRINQQPGPNITHPGVAEAGVVTEVKGKDSEGHTYPAASDLFQVSLSYDAAQSLFTCTIANISNGKANETPFSGGVFVVSNVIDNKLVVETPFFNVDQKSGAELTQLAESGNVDPLKKLVTDQTGIITTLHGAIVVIYTGNTNPIYQLGQKDAQLGLSALAQRGDPDQLRASLEKVPQVRRIYTIADNVQPGTSMECTYEAAADEKIAFATMFGYSNDWFFANGPELNALTKGDVTSKTVLLDDGTAVSQYPGAGNAQYIFGGTVMPEDKAISAVGNTFPVPTVDEIIKVTIY